MKRSLSLLLATLMLLFALTACGRSNDMAQTNDRNDPQSESAVTGGNPANNGTNAGTNTGTNAGTHNGTAGDANGNGSLLDDAGNAVEDGLNGLENAVDDLTGNKAETRTGGTMSR